MTSKLDELIEIVKIYKDVCEKGRPSLRHDYKARIHMARQFFGAVDQAMRTEGIHGEEWEKLRKVLFK